MTLKLLESVKSAKSVYKDPVQPSRPETWRLKKAEREFESALRQSKGQFEEAEYNLKLCRYLFDTSTRSQLASLKMIESAAVLTKIDSRTRGKRGDCAEGWNQRRAILKYD
jgi:hypothetical protein